MNEVTDVLVNIIELIRKLFCTLYLSVSGIIMPSLKSKGQL